MFALLLLLCPMVYSHPNHSFYLDGSLDIIERTRANAEILKEHLWYIARNPENMEIINKVFVEENRAFIHSMKDVINAIETGTKLVQNEGAELLQLFQPIQSSIRSNAPCSASWMFSFQRSLLPHHHILDRMIHFHYSAVLLPSLKNFQ